MDRVLKNTFASLRVRNFRLFIMGQAISLCGTWMQTIGLSWLILSMTHSGTQLGLIIAAQYVPILVFGAWGGVIADRFNKRHVLYATQSLAGILALVLGMLVVTHSVQIWMLYTLAAALGLVTVADNPTRQSFVIEMAGPDHVRNAVTLNSIMVNAARVVGPSIAGILIATVGIGACFLANAVSYIAVLVALALMRHSELYPAPIAPKGPGQVKAGLQYVWSEPKLRATLIMMFIIGTFAFEFSVVFPLFATDTLHGNAATYSAMMTAMGIGAIIGGLYTAGSTSNLRESQLFWVALLFGVSTIVTAVMPTLGSTLFALVLVGALSVLFVALGNTTLQLSSDPTMRGRVMALWAIAFLGTTPIGGPIMGYICQHSNPRIGLAVGGLSSVIAAYVGYMVYAKASLKPAEILVPAKAESHF